MGGVVRQNRSFPGTSALALSRVPCSKTAQRAIVRCSRQPCAAARLRPDPAAISAPCGPLFAGGYAPFATKKTIPSDNRMRAACAAWVVSQNCLLSRNELETNSMLSRVTATSSSSSSFVAFQDRANGSSALSSYIMPQKTTRTGRPAPTRLCNFLGAGICMNRGTQSDRGAFNTFSLNTL